MRLRVVWLSRSGEQRGAVSRQLAVAPPWRARVTPLQLRRHSVGRDHMHDSGTNHVNEALPPSSEHLPVLLGEVVEYLAPRPGAVIVDATIGLGGHSQRLLPLLGTTGHLIGIDQDPEALRVASERLGSPPSLVLEQANFRELPSVLQDAKRPAIDGLLVDLGVSSLQLGTPKRGFSFQANGPLDMRMDPRNTMTAGQLINYLSEMELADCFFQLGEERYARRIARAVVCERRAAPIDTTMELADIVARAVPRRGGRLHPATRVFQALRVAVNRELEALEHLLRAVPTFIKPGGRVVIIAFHSLEDRLVKQTFRSLATTGPWRLLTKKPVRPSAQEVAANPRSRSARLRAVLREE